MNEQSLRAAVLVVSTTAANDASTDRVIPTLSPIFAPSSQFTLSSTAIVPDSAEHIEAVLRQWTDPKSPTCVNLIVTSGGTGFAVKDITPEVVSGMLERHAYGLVHHMMASSLAVTPFAAMARPVAGTIGGTVVITLPGSPKGAKENLEAVISLLPHACMQAAGGDSRNLHVGGVEKLERDAGVQRKGGTGGSQSQQYKHEHHHHHDHGHGGHKAPRAHTSPSEHPQSNDPSLGPIHRQRKSPYSMLSVSDALSTISSETPEPRVISIPLSHCAHTSYVLAKDVLASESVPAFRASIVDGYAIRISGSGENGSKGTFPVVGFSHAAAAKDMPALKVHELARITTGAPLPEGSDAVVMVEDTKIAELTEDQKEEKTVEVLTDKVQTGENVREVGSDVKKGEVVMRAGEGISVAGGEFGLLASVGTREVSVYKKPVIGVLSTGDEIVPFNREGELKLGEVRDTNRPTLLMLAKSWGYETLDLGIASDKPTSLESSLRQALQKVDVLITSGGVSMGELDLLKPTIERSIGGTIHFGRVSMKPGKPTTFATVPAENIKDPESGDKGAAGKRVIFSLPGNPASAVVTFLLFVLPSLQQMSGISPVGLPVVQVKLESTVKCDPAREEYHRVVVAPRPGDSTLYALSTGGQRSSRIGSFKGANALLRLPAGGGVIEKGSFIDALLIGQVAGAV